MAADVVLLFREYITGVGHFLCRAAPRQATPGGAQTMKAEGSYVACGHKGKVAESEGFEPPIALRLCLISSQVHSTGLCQLSSSEVQFT